MARGQRCRNNARREFNRYWRNTHPKKGSGGGDKNGRLTGPVFIFAGIIALIVYMVQNW